MWFCQSWKSTLRSYEIFKVKVLCRKCQICERRVFKKKLIEEKIYSSSPHFISIRYLYNLPISCLYIIYNIGKICVIKIKKDKYRHRLRPWNCFCCSTKTHHHSSNFNFCPYCVVTCALRQKYILTLSRRRIVLKSGLFFKGLKS